jgi:hypothetical protein
VNVFVRLEMIAGDSMATGCGKEGAYFTPEPAMSDLARVLVDDLGLKVDFVFTINTTFKRA